MPNESSRTRTKKHLIDQVAESTGITRNDSELAVQCMLDTVIEWLADGYRIEFRDFGVFESRRRKAHMAKNPKTLTPVEVLARQTVKFKAGKRMRDEIDLAMPPTGISQQIEPKPGADSSVRHNSQNEGR